MVRPILAPVLGMVLFAVLGQVAVAQDNVAQPMQPDQTIIVRPNPSQRVVVESPAAVAPAPAVVPAPAPAVVPEERVTVRREAGPIQHDAEVSRLPAGGVAAVESAVPGGTIVDVDKMPLMKAWEVKVVDAQGQVHKVHVDSKGQASNVRIDDGENRQVAKLTEAEKSAVRQRFPDAAIYDSEYAFVNGKHADKVYLLSQGQRYEVKVDRSSGEIYKVENESQEGEHRMGHEAGAKAPKTTTDTYNHNY